MSDLHPSEVKVAGLHAVRAVFACRPEAVVRAWVTQERLADVGDLLRILASRHIAYHVVEPAELDKISATEHHQGITIIARRQPLLSLDMLIDRLEDARGPIVLLALDGVENPHNFGAVLRVAAHFGVAAVLVPRVEGFAGLSSAVFRTAEGGAEYVDVAVVGPLDPAFAVLDRYGFTTIATSSHAEQSIYDVDWPERVIIVMGGETHGVSELVAYRARHYVSIPGTGFVESLNVATATAVLLAAGQRPAPRALASFGAPNRQPRD
jgi:TrmH RNA methyltransferase